MSFSNLSGQLGALWSQRTVVEDSIYLAASLEKLRVYVNDSDGFNRELLAGRTDPVRHFHAAQHFAKAVDVAASCISMFHGAMPGGRARAWLLAALLVSVSYAQQLLEVGFMDVEACQALQKPIARLLNDERLPQSIRELAKRVADQVEQTLKEP